MQQSRVAAMKDKNYGKNGFTRTEIILAYENPKKLVPKDTNSWSSKCLCSISLCIRLCCIRKMTTHIDLEGMRPKIFSYRLVDTIDLEIFQIYGYSVKRFMDTQVQNKYQTDLFKFWYILQTFIDTQSIRNAFNSVYSLVCNVISGRFSN